MNPKVLSKKPYDNHKMLSIDGKFLAYVSEKRMKWYLERDLAEMINDTDFKLLFKSKGDNVEGKYYKLELENRCVISGLKDNLTKHHVVPYQYRKYFPAKYKSRNSFDILCVNDKEHRKYEKFADELKEKILKENGLENYDKNAIITKKALHALENYSDLFDSERKDELIGYVEEFFDDSFDNILDNETATNFEFEPAASLIVRNLDDIEEFIIMWRKHFIDYAKPKFLPQEWYDEMYEIKKI